MKAEHRSLDRRKTNLDIPLFPCLIISCLLVSQREAEYGDEAPPGMYRKCNTGCASKTYDPCGFFLRYTVSPLLALFCSPSDKQTRLNVFLTFYLLNHKSYPQICFLRIIIPPPNIENPLITQTSNTHQGLISLCLLQLVMFSDSYLLTHPYPHLVHHNNNILHHVEHQSIHEWWSATPIVEMPKSYRSSSGDNICTNFELW